MKAGDLILIEDYESSAIYNYTQHARATHAVTAFAEDLYAAGLEAVNEVGGGWRVYERGTAPRTLMYQGCTWWSPLGRNAPGYRGASRGNQRGEGNGRRLF